jgi:hypothetical protein
MLSLPAMKPDSGMPELSLCVPRARQQVSKPCGLGPLALMLCSSCSSALLRRRFDGCGAARWAACGGGSPPLSARCASIGLSHSWKWIEPSVSHKLLSGLVFSPATLFFCAFGWGSFFVHALQPSKKTGEGIAGKVDSLDMPPTILDGCV